MYSTVNESVKDVQLCHKRFAHISEKGLEQLNKQGLLGKLKLDYIHSDLWGPARVSTHGGSRYFLTLIDDFSRKLWVYLLRTKYEVYDKFIVWKNLIEN